MSIDPLVLFSIQFTFALVAYGLAARWYLVPRLKPLPVAAALVPLVWVHVGRIAGGSILAPGSAGPGVPDAFREMVGYGDMVVGVLALGTVIALRARWSHAIAAVWVFVAVATLDTVNAIIQSMRYSVFDYPLGVNWVIVTLYVPALLVSTYLIVLELLRANKVGETDASGSATSPRDP
jgi:hypothetical protein